MNEVSIGIDLGGTRIKSVVLDGKGNLLYENYRPTNDGDGDTWKKEVAKVVNEYKSVLKVNNIKVGISAPGLPNKDKTCISCMPGRLQGLEQLNWPEYLDAPSIVLNDAVAALIAEAKFGAAAGKENVVMLTLGTGVGGAILINGKPYLGAMNKAGHFGHMVVNDEGETDITGMPGSLEDCIGNCSIQKRSKEKFSSTEMLLEAYRSGDDFAKEIWMKSVRQLGISLASIANMLSPEVIVIGGGIAAAGDDLFIPLEKFIQQYEWQPSGIATPIVKAACGDLAGAIGAACFAKAFQ